MPGMAIPNRPGWLTRWASDTPSQAGVIGAAWSVAGSLARGLLPRSPLDQAITTSVVATVNYELTATGWAALEAAAALPGRRPGTTARLVVAGLAIASGYATAFATSRRAAESPIAAAGYAVGRQTAFAGIAGAAASIWDELLHKRLGLRPGFDTTVVPNLITGGAIAAGNVYFAVRRAHRYGTTTREHRFAGVNTRSVAVASAAGVGATVGLGTLVVTEQFAARAIENGLARIIGRDPGAIGALIAHSTLLGGLTVITGAALRQITVRLQRNGDVVEPAYPEPPTSAHVSAGPASTMPFDAIGKEGRRFVLMALDAQDITSVMGEAAIDPVRVVGGFESTAEIRERAKLTLADLEACGGFERGLICVASPTGVGYVNYTIIEALEYLTRGNCATVVPQYALVPSALAMPRTAEGVHLTKLVLEGIRDRISTMPPDRRPRVVLLGESLGANVALDVSTLPGPYVGIPALDHLGVSGGVYFGVPFRTEFWQRWRAHPEAMDPEDQLLCVSQPDEAPVLPPGQMRHLMVIHHDDPVNKYGYSMVLQPPWWMGPPATRPPGVPRETRFRPVTTFALATVDLLNGMNSKPGEFLRRGHDYRIDARLGLQRSYGLDCSPAQAEAIEQALRQRETEWAARRMIARTLDRARRSIAEKLGAWGDVNVDVADLDPALAEAVPGTALQRLGRISAPPAA
jgi:uncharacterized membrane protein